jgi:hypothetical protein
MTNAHLPTEYLYIAQQIGSAGVLKAGRTTTDPRKRNRALPGQTTESFKLLFVSETRNSKKAERLMHAMLDQGMHRRVGGKRKEQFEVTFDSAKRYAKEAAHFINKTEKPATPRSVPLPLMLASPTSAFFKAMMSLPVTFETKNFPLREMLSRVRREAAVARRLKSIGIVQSNFEKNAIEVVFDWSFANLLEWVTLQGVSPPDILPTSLRLKIIA